MPPSSLPLPIVLGITGASGALYAHRLVQLLVTGGTPTHVVISPLGQRLLAEELGLALHPADPASRAALAGLEPESPQLEHLHLHPHRDVGAVIASGSFRHAGMIVAPCSSNTLSAIATGQAQNLIHRAAHVTLKERRRLVLLHREAPLSLVDIRNMATVTEAGAIVFPASPGFYLHPRGIEDLVDFVVGRCLDLLQVPHDLNIRWQPRREIS